ncbi:MAG: tetratricopeptide repeat protein [Promethearchaeota archaeon]
MGFKFPIYLPIQHSYPLELASFNFSFYLRPRWLDDKFEIRFQQFMTDLLDFYNFLHDEYPLNYNFQFTDFESELLAEISKYLPDDQNFDINSNGSESYLYKQIKSNIIEKDTRLLYNIGDCGKNIEKICGDYNFSPSQTPPLELKNNIPYLQRNKFLYYSDPNQTENIMTEPGSISYWNDKMIKNIWTRSGFESYLEHSLLNLQNQSPDFQFNHEKLITTLIDYARGISMEFSTFLETESPLETKLLNPFSERKFRLEQNNFDICHGIWLPSINFTGDMNIVVENSDSDLLDSPAKNLSELSYLDRFFQGKMFFYQNNMMKAENLLHNLQEDIPRDRFPNFTIQILLFLNKINEKLKHHSQAIVYLKRGLEIAKLGHTPIVIILELHFKLIKNYFYQKSDGEKANHENIVQKFIENYPTSKGKSKIQLELDFWYILWDIEEEKIESAEKRLGKIKNPGKLGSEFEIRLNYLWAQIYLKKNDLSKMFTAYEKNFKISSRMSDKNFYMAKSYLEFVNQHFKKPDPSSFLFDGFKKLQKAIDYLDFNRKPSNLILLTEIYSKLIEICLKMKKNDLAIEYQQILADYHKIIQYYVRE